MQNQMTAFLDGPMGSICKYLGLATGVYLTTEFARMVWFYMRPSSLPKYHHGKPGSTWALVTGASDGIGRGFVDNLLAQGFNVLMHGRNPSKLAGVQKEVAAKYPNLEIRTVVADVSIYNIDVDSIVAAVDSLPGPLTVLVNNVGGVIPGSIFNLVENQSASEVDAVITLNARFPAQLTRSLLPTLKKNGPSLIITMGSIAGIVGTPYTTIYSACKAFDHLFSKALKSEIAAEGADVEVLGILCGRVLSGGQTMFLESFLVPSSDTMAKAVLKRVGCGSSLVFAYFGHRVEYAMTNLLPEAVLEKISCGIIQGLMRDATKKQ